MKKEKTKEEIMKTYSELRHLLKQTQEKARKAGDSEALKEIEKYQTDMTKNVNDFNKKTLSLEKLSKEIDKNNKLISAIKLKEKTKPLKKEQTERKEGGGFLSNLPFLSKLKKKYSQPDHTGEKGKKPFKLTKKQELVMALILILSLFLSGLIFLGTKEKFTTIVSFPIILILLSGYAILRKKLARSKKIKEMEAVFPDFLQLMSSNLRAGITTDKALLLSARKEFAPLDKEIIKLGKDLVTGKKIESALEDMSNRIKSEKISKTINLITSGIRSGGNMAILLEETSANMKARDFIEKRSTSNIVMYVIFIFFAIAVGAPALFALSSVLVQILSGILSTIPEVGSSQVNLPFTLTSISISPEFVRNFAFIFILATDIMGAFVLGLVSKGDEKEGLKYLIVLIAISLTVFLGVRAVLLKYFSGLFGG